MMLTGCRGWTQSASRAGPGAGDYTDYPVHILHACATVEEVVNWVNTHQWRSYMHDQMQFADATGGAVMISADGRGGGLYPQAAGDGFLVSTNFNVANPVEWLWLPLLALRQGAGTAERSWESRGALTAQAAAGMRWMPSTSSGGPVGRSNRWSPICPTGSCTFITFTSSTGRCVDVAEEMPLRV